MSEKVLIGKITHFFSAIGVAVIELSGSLSVGDSISVEGASTNFKQKVESMQVEQAHHERFSGTGSGYEGCR